MAKELEHIGFTQLKSDPSIYTWVKDDVRVTLPVFVDDITITSKSKSKIAGVKTSLAKVFKLKDLGPTTYLLGIKVEYNQSNRILRLSQTQYIIDMLTRFRLADCKPVTTPMDPGAVLNKSQSPTTKEEIKEMRNIPYMNAVGALMYLAIGTRPDIAYAVAKLARFNSCYGMAHWKAVKHLFRYLKGTMDLKLTYRASGDDPVTSELFHSYSDAGYGGCLDTCKSTSGFVMKMGTGAISWSSKKQPTIANLSTEAEYVSAASTG